MYTKFQEILYHSFAIFPWVCIVIRESDVNVKTRDGLLLHGLLTEPVKPVKTIDIHIHGAGGNFYGNSYFEGLTLRLVDLGTAYLATNNRGAVSTNSKKAASATVSH